MTNISEEITALNEKIAEIQAEYNNINVYKARIELLNKLSFFDRIDFQRLNDYQINQISAKLDEIENIVNTQ